MDTSHWHWTIFGWEKLYSTNLTKLKDENGTRGIPRSTDHHWLFGPRKVVKKNKYPVADRVHGNLGTLNSRRESKAGGPMNSVEKEEHCLGVIWTKGIKTAIASIMDIKMIKSRRSYRNVSVNLGDTKHSATR